MEEKARELSERLLNYSAEIVKLTIKIKKTSVGKQMANQLLRCGTSVGANYEEACGTESRADFIHKLQIVFKEVRESLYWVSLIQKTVMLANKDLSKIIDETRQISNILAKSIITAKKGK